MTLAVAWTLVVAWMTVTLGFVAARSGGSLKDLMTDTPDLYLVLLGGPYSAAVFAKIAVSNGVRTDRVQKPPATSTNIADVVCDDAGSTDLYDFQYTLFNLVAILIVVCMFGAQPGKGFPGIPDFLAILTGGSALAYTVNKVAAVNGPSLIDVQPPTARMGDSVTVIGTNLLPPAAQC